MMEQTLTTTKATSQPPTVEDKYGRVLRYLRVSVTDVCNLSCHYCNPVKNTDVAYREKLGWDDLAFMVETAVTHLGVEALRITGGEPTARPGLVDWIRQVSALPGVKDVAMTTNGMRLAAMAEPLAVAGLRRVNVSIDSFDSDRFRHLTRGGLLEKCLQGIDVARTNFERVKLNAVLLKGENAPGELMKFVEFSDHHEVEVRFIELMPIFKEKDYFHQHFFGVEEAIESLRTQGVELLAPEGKANPHGYGPATTYRVAKSRARIGFISQMSDTKCAECNKLRITSDGALKACLLSPQEEDLTAMIRDRDGERLAFAMAQSFLQRAERYRLEEALNDPFNRGMQAVGG